MNNTDTLRYASIMFAAGMGIPLLAALNAQLGSRIGSPPAAAIVLFCVAVLGAAAVTLATGGISAMMTVPTQPRYLFLAGLLVALYVISITWVAPKFGLGNAIFCVLLGQIFSAAMIDHFALLGAAHHPFNLWRAIGLLGMLSGLAMVLKS